MNKHRSSGRASKSRTLVRDRGGAVYVEFLLAFIPLFFLFLGMVQMGLVYACDLVVRHAAVTAARAAAVVIDDNPENYDGDTRRIFESDGEQRDTVVRSVIEAILGGGGGRSRPPRIDSERYSDIHSAASMPLLPFAPPINMIWSSPNDENVLNAIGTMPEGRAAFGLVYNEAGLALSFPASPTERDDFRSVWGAPNDEGVVDEEEGRQVTARVTYLFHCAVPLANRLMCEDLFAIAYGVDAGRVAQITNAFIRGDLTFSEFQEELNGLRSSRDRLNRWQPRTEELQGSGGEVGIDLLGAMAGISAVFGGPAPRFLPIQREATMPLQAANYCYYEADDNSDCWEQETN